MNNDNLSPQAQEALSALASERVDAVLRRSGLRAAATMTGADVSDSRLRESLAAAGVLIGDIGPARAELNDAVGIAARAIDVREHVSPVIDTWTDEVRNAWWWIEMAGEEINDLVRMDEGQVVAYAAAVAANYDYYEAEGNGADLPVRADDVQDLWSCLCKLGC